MTSFIRGSEGGTTACAGAGLPAGGIVSAAGEPARMQGVPAGYGII
jgi:hypothetical protein